MRSLDPQLPCLFHYWPFKKYPPHNNKTCLTVVNVISLIFSIPDDDDWSWQELVTEKVLGGGSARSLRSRTHSDFRSLLGMLSCVVESWPCAVGRSLWSCCLESDLWAGEQPPSWNWL